MSPFGQTRLNGATSSNLALPAIFLAVLVVMLPMLVQGVPDGNDLLQHMRFAAAYHDAIVRGDFIPAWVGGENSGYGSIGVRYYPPFAYVLLAVGKMLSGSWYYSFLANAFFWMLAGCLGVYLWAREWVDAPLAVFASVLYAIAPYHTFQIYQAVLFAEFAAAGVIPFCFLFLTRTCREPNRRNAVLLAISASLLVLTHIPSTIIGVLGLGVYALFILDRSKLAATFKCLFGAGIAVMCSTAFHWIKLVTEISWVKHSLPNYYASGYYDYHKYFFPMYLVAPAERYVQRLLWHLDISIVLTILFAVPAVVLIIRRLRGSLPTIAEARHSSSLGGAFTVSILMLSMASSFVWNAVPFLAKLQFPWRWLLVSTAVGPVLFVAASSWLTAPSQKPGRVQIYLTTSFVLGLALFSLTQNALLSGALSESKFTTLVTEMNEREACPCWWPVWAKGEALNRSEKAAAGARHVSIIEWADERRAIFVSDGEPQDLRVATFYHPYWKALVNGVEAPVTSDPAGAITIALPAYAARIELAFTEPRILSAAKALSVMLWAVMLILAAMEWMQRRLS
ncbi:MAG: 6-pyruvoyl-tetrahydropterin synthase-related protein [Pyrinomonadaceae bacterium]